MQSGFPKLLIRTSQQLKVKNIDALQIQNPGAHFWLLHRVLIKVVKVFFFQIKKGLEKLLVHYPKC